MHFLVENDKQIRMKRKETDRRFVGIVQQNATRHRAELLAKMSFTRWQTEVQSSRLQYYK